MYILSYACSEYPKCWYIVNIPEVSGIILFETLLFCVHFRSLLFNIQTKLDSFKMASLVPTRWAPTRYKWSYTPHKWLYKWVTGVIPSLKTWPLKIDLPKRKVVFQPSIFRCELLGLGRVTPISGVMGPLVNLIT